MDDDRGTLDEARESGIVVQIAVDDVRCPAGAASRLLTPAGQDAKAETGPVERREQVSTEEARGAGQGDERRRSGPALGSPASRQATDETAGGLAKAPDSSICRARVRLNLPEEVCGRLCGGTSTTDVSTP